MNLFVRFETLRAPSFLRAPRGALRPSMAEGGTKGDTKGSANDASRHIGGTKSTFGPQPMSTRTSPAIYGFGSSTREDREKVFVSHEHAALACDSSRSPGPIYNHLPAIGPQPTGTFSSAPTWVFGSSEQRPSAENKSLLENPAPGKYDMERSIGVQHESKKETQPRYGFGTGTREHREKVFVSHEHSKTEGSRDAPGPGQYPMPALTGKPVKAGLQKSGAAWGFGSSKRFSDFEKERAPGPGYYVI